MESRRRYIIAGAEEKEKESKMSKDKSEVSVSGGESDQGSMFGVERKRSGVRPWRITQDVPRACLDVVIAGVGYLL